MLMRSLAVALSPLFYSAHTHRLYTQKSPVFERAQRGLTSHFTRVGAYQEAIPDCVSGAQTIATSDQSGGDA